MSSQLARPSLAGDILTGALKNPQIQTQLVSGLLGLLGPLILGLLAKIGGQGKHVIEPASERPQVGEGDDLLDDDKLVPPKMQPKPSSALKDYTAVKLGVKQAQYNRELFPDQYTDDNKMGLYRPARVGTYNRKSKIWFDCSPLKGSHVVQFEEGARDGVLWKPTFYIEFEGNLTTCYANESQRQDTVNGANRPIQVVEGDAAVGFSAWDFSNGYTCQINVGENEGRWRVWVELLGFKSEVIEFSVS